MDLFLASVERRAYGMARIATGEREEALDLVQEAMLSLVRKYRFRPEGEWRVLFFTILQSRIRDWRRRQAVRRRLRIWLNPGRGRDEPDPEEGLESVAESPGRNPEQKTLKPLADRWDQLTPAQQERYQKGARRWMSMSPEERDRAKERWKAWKDMPPEQRDRLRSRFERFRQLPPEQQERLRRAREWFRSLPQERRDELKERWRNLPADKGNTLRNRIRELTPEEREALRERWKTRQGAP
jgi:DNA-directed RNA polymerase specialized sigma24 family protein